MVTMSKLKWGIKFALTFSGNIIIIVVIIRLLACSAKKTDESKWLSEKTIVARLQMLPLKMSFALAKHTQSRYIRT